MNDTNPFPIGQIEEGFSLYLPPYDFDASLEVPKVISANKQNRKCSVKRITGSFIYAHPADYCGRPMLYASEVEWCDLFNELQHKHIDTVIFQAVLWRELGECYYQSQRYNFLQQYRVVENMLAAAADKKMTVYLGGYGSVAGWAKRLSEEQLCVEIAEHKACFTELSKMGKFNGCYFPCETAYHGERNAEAERRMNRLYRSFSDTVKAFDPSLQVIASPAGRLYPGKTQEFLDFWQAILLKSNVDILMPHDSVGNCNCTLPELLPMWSLWKQVSDNSGTTLWAHVEIFERRSFFEKVNLYPAAPERVAAQAAIASAVTEKLVAWEVPYFGSAVSGKEGERLSHYLEHQQ